MSHCGDVTANVATLCIALCFVFNRGPTAEYQSQLYINSERNFTFDFFLCVIFLHFGKHKNIRFQFYCLQFYTSYHRFQTSVLSRHDTLLLSCNFMTFHFLLKTRFCSQLTLPFIDTAWLKKCQPLLRKSCQISNVLRILGENVAHHLLLYLTYAVMV